MEEEVKLAKQGDKLAYQRLIEDLSVYLYNIAQAMLKNDEQSADAISNTILKAYTKLKTLKKPEYFKTWISRILINECKDILRKNKKIVYIEEYYNQANEQEVDTISKEEKIDVIDAINKLDKKTKDVVILYYYNELKIEEIAKILNLPEGTVKSRMNTAKNKLYDLLQGRSENYNG